MGKSKIRFIQTGDWHLGQTWPSLPSETAQKLKSKQADLFPALKNACRDNQVDFVLCTGDMFDQVRPSRKWLTPFIDMVEDLDIPVIIAPGNHDPILPGTSWLGATWPINAYIFSRERSVFEFPQLDTMIMGLAFEHQTAIKPGHLPGFNPDGDSVFQIVAVHGDLIDSKSPFRPLPADVIRNSNADYLAAGHNHQLIIAEDSEVPYASAGAPLGRGFSEPGSKAFLIGELSGELLKGGRANLDLVTQKQMQKQKRISLRLEEYPLFLPAFVSLEYHCSAEDNSADVIRSIKREISARLASSHPDDFWQVSLQGERTAQVKPAVVKDSLKQDLHLIEIKDERRAQFFPRKGYRIIFPGLDLKGSAIDNNSVSGQKAIIGAPKAKNKKSRDEQQKDLAVTYLDAAIGILNEPGQLPASGKAADVGKKNSPPRKR